MRHLERTHGISIASMHEHFQKDHFVLIYEITAKMAADIHTKGFKNPMAWKKACMLINLLEPQDLRSKEVLEMLQPSTDVDMTTRQVFQSKTDEIPNFPYTETPILPKEVYRERVDQQRKATILARYGSHICRQTASVLSSETARSNGAARCFEIHMDSSQWYLDEGRRSSISTRAGSPF